VLDGDLLLAGELEALPHEALDEDREVAGGVGILGQRRVDRTGLDGKLLDRLGREHARELVGELSSNLAGDVGAVRPAHGLIHLRALPPAGRPGAPCMTLRRLGSSCSLPGRSLSGRRRDAQLAASARLDRVSSTLEGGWATTTSE